MTAAADGAVVVGFGWVNAATVSGDAFLATTAASCWMIEPWNCCLTRCSNFHRDSMLCMHDH